MTTPPDGLDPTPLSPPPPEGDDAPTPLFERWLGVESAARRVRTGVGAAAARAARAAHVAGRALQRLGTWLANPLHLRRVLYVLLPALVAIGLLSPPVSLGTRLWSLTYHRLRPGVDATVQARGAPGAELLVYRYSIGRAARADLEAQNDLPAGTEALPDDATALTDFFRLRIRGPAPREAYLHVDVPVSTEDQPFVDAFGWDGARWRWLQSQWIIAGRLKVLVPTGDYVPDTLVVARAETGRPAVSAVLLPPPSALPAAAAELPILEVRAFTLERDDGLIARRPVVPVNPQAQVYGVADNREEGRVRGDLINNILTRPETRLRHRSELVRAAQADHLAGIVLDYDDIDEGLNDAWAGFVALLGADLRRVGKRLIVNVPMPRLAAGEWSGGNVEWRRIGDGADGVRVRLPGGAPLSTAALDSLVQWCLTAVDRRKLQLAIPVQGQDIVDNIVTPIRYGEALGRILDIARSDAPDRITPGRETTIELPTIRASELGKDDATQRWRFFYWDANRRQHTVWLTDVEGLRPVFDTAAYYRIGSIVLDGVSNGVDPFLWRMVRTYLREGEARTGQSSYRLRWQLLDAAGRIVMQADQPLDAPTFRFDAPRTVGDYRLSVNLMTGDGELAAPGAETVVLVAEPPPPPPTPTQFAIVIEVTPESIETAASPDDETRARAPVTIGGDGGEDAAAVAFDAMLDVADTALRAAPNVEAREITTLRKGDRLIRIDVSDDARWWLVRIGSTGVQGWVFASFLVTPTPTPPQTATSAPSGTLRPGAPSAPPATPPATPPAGALPTATAQRALPRPTRTLRPATPAATGALSPSPTP
ncbi:MAG: SH3 domain-containing protein [Ardenticatenales bacterium]|nr:SH3 domain-containing protein [Ardenticatenales bacterium]